MRAEPAQTQAGGPGPAQGITGSAREQDLPTVRRRADPGHGVHRKADVARVGQRRPAAVEADPDLDADVFGPGARAQAAFDPQRRLQRRRGTNEDGKELIRTRIDLAAAGAVHAARG